MRCENCGRGLADDAAFCPDCGARAATSAGGVYELARTAGLIGGSVASGIPDAPEPAEAAKDVPEVPEPAELPEVGADRVGGTDTADVAAPEDFLDSAKVREVHRRAAQAIVETAQSDLRDELADIARRDDMLEAASRDAADLARSAEQERMIHPAATSPPPPPPPSAYEQMSAETSERAAAQSMSPDAQEAVEVSGGRCCAAGCVIFILLVGGLMALGFWEAQQDAEETEPPSAEINIVILNEESEVEMTKQPHVVYARTEREGLLAPEGTPREVRAMQGHNSPRRLNDVLH